MSTRLFSTNRFCLRLRRASVVCGCVGASVGLVALLGWITGNPLLQGGLVADITMKTNAAICVTLMGLLVCALGLGERARRWLPSWLVRVCAGLVVCIAAATLLQHLFGVSFGIDELLFREP